MSTTVDVAPAFRSAPLDQLEETVRILQAAHDKIEDQTYFSVGDYGGTGGPVCYIGAVQAVTERSANPYHLPHNLKDSTRCALEALDTAAIGRGATEGLPGRAEFPGRTAESLGRTNPEYGHTKEGALRVYRDAIREVCAEVEARREAE